MSENDQYEEQLDETMQELYYWIDRGYSPEVAEAIVFGSR